MAVYINNPSGASTTGYNMTTGLLKSFPPLTIRMFVNIPTGVFQANRSGLFEIDDSVSGAGIDFITGPTGITFDTIYSGDTALISSSISTNAWYYVAVTYVYVSTGSGTIKTSLYYKKVGTRSFITLKQRLTSVGNPVTTANALSIGYDTTGSFQGFIGSITGVCIWSSILSVDQLMLDSNSILPNISLNNLFASWPLTDTNTIIDPRGYGAGNILTVANPSAISTVTGPRIALYPAIYK